MRGEKTDRLQQPILIESPETMSLKDLSEQEQDVVLRCLRASVDGPFFPDWEFSTLFGLEREEVAFVIRRWPVDDEQDEEAALAIHGALNNLLGYPHGEPEAWRNHIAFTHGEVRAIYEKWRGRSNRRDRHR